MILTELKQRLQSQFPHLSERKSADCLAFESKDANNLAIMRHLKDKEHFDLLVDVTALDEGEEADQRFWIIYHLFSTSHHTYLRLVFPCPNEIDSVESIWPAANWHERETYDMFGIQFKGHPNLTRILMWEGYPYFPLRKDFPLAGEETELPAPDVVERTQARVEVAPQAGGPFVAAEGKGTLKDKEPTARDQSWREHHSKPKA